MASMPQPAVLPLVRVTCLGASSSGKTALINSFVNGFFPLRAQSTEHSRVLYRRFETEDEDFAAAPQRRCCLVEVEDTPGSERGGDAAHGRRNGVGGQGGCSAGSTSAEAAQDLRKGDKVKVLFDTGRLAQVLVGHALLAHAPEMVERLAGRQCTVQQVYKTGTLTVLTQDGHVVDLPHGAVERTLAMSLPIDEFLELDAKPIECRKTSTPERRKHQEQLDRPLSAFRRPIGPPGTDKSVTRNRMGFLLCFDLSDEEGESLKEALVLHRMLQTRAERRRQAHCAAPIVALVGCKSDKTAIESVARRNKQMAKSFSEDAEIPFYLTSARNHTGVADVFRDVVLAIQDRHMLWSHLFSVGDEGGENEEEGGYCASQ